MSQKAYVAGVGMIPFVKPGASGSYIEMGAEATRLALKDAGLDYNLVQQAYVGYVYGDSTYGQSALYEVGLPQQQVRSLAMRFTGITQLGRIPTCTGRVVEKFEENGEKRVRLAIRCGNQHGEEKLLGEAVVALA
jgi:hypothetical protein